MNIVEVIVDLKMHFHFNFILTYKSLKYVFNMHIKTSVENWQI